MKVKEIPAAYYHLWRLRSLPIHRLKEPERETAPVVVSLASIPSRLHVVDLVIRCMLDQDLLPERILLWLHNDAKPVVPGKLKVLQHDRFEIRYTALDCPHTKLIHSLESYPNVPVVTCDDDLIYTRDWLRTLYETHLRQPGCVIANRMRHIRRDTAGNLLPYRQWNRDPGEDEDPRHLLPIGSAGVLYPPGSLDPRVQDQETFSEICPRADDLWFKMMTLLRGSCLAEPVRTFPEPIPIPGSQKVSLKRTNIGGDQNVVQWQRLTEHYQVDV